jgi:hypothetical protein
VPVTGYEFAGVFDGRQCSTVPDGQQECQQDGMCRAANARPEHCACFWRGFLPLSRFLVIGGCFYNERNHRVGPITYAPGSEAPEGGTYEQLDVFRIPTGITEHVIRGERLPLAPQGYTWRKMANDRAALGL